MGEVGKYKGQHGGILGSKDVSGQRNSCN